VFLYSNNQVVLAGLVRGGHAACAADALAHGGAGCIIFTGRSQAELQSIIDHLHRKYHQTKIIFITADGGNLASMSEAADTIKKLDVPIDGIIGFPTVTAAAWELTPHGIESHFQRNYLCYFVLVNSLTERMSAGARVVLVTTSVRQEAPAPMWEDVNFSVSLFSRNILFETMLIALQKGETYHPLDGYAQSMFANIIFAKSLAQRSIAAFSANPGSGCDRKLLRFTANGLRYQK
jgi:NAD(P)-dependent dehydrogenase (short-subunit alcohol dehydrogenase family)